MNGKAMPAVKPPVKLEAAFHLIISVSDHYEHPGRYTARWSFYLDGFRCIEYRSRWMLKTEAGALARAKREAAQYLNDLRRQIGEVIRVIEGGKPAEDGFISIPSSAYAEYVPDEDEKESA